MHPRLVANKTLLDMLLSRNDHATHDNSYRYITIKSSNWNEDSALELMCTKLKIKNNNFIGSNNNNNNNFIMLSSLIDLENSQLKKSMGALLNYMQTNVFHFDQGVITIANIGPLQTIEHMRIDHSTFNSLQIFNKEVHPNLISGSGKKEGFSLFSLFDRTKSLPGRAKLKEWMSKPFANKNCIIKRQMGVDLVVRIDNRDFITDVSKLFRHVHDVPKILLRIKKVEGY